MTGIPERIPTDVDATRSWDNRVRAESFGQLAQEYDDVRPSYPAALVSQIVAGLPRRPARAGRLQVLDVGTGTGKLGRTFPATVDVLGNELDPGMAAVARRHGVTVQVGPFEQFVGDGRFDRVVAAQAWHWIHPEAGLNAARRALAPGGQLWLLWNFGAIAPALQAQLDAVYARLAPQLSEHSVARGGGRSAADITTEQLTGVRGARIDTLDVPWDHSYPRAEWIRLLRTYSDHAVLPGPQREQVLAEIGRVVDAAGGSVAVAYTAHAVVVDGLAP